MRTLNCCVNKPTGGRCFTPLIEICDSTSQIKLDLGSCGVCSTKPAALLLSKAGCPEWETICEPPPDQSCCGVVDTRPAYYGSKRVIEKPKPAVVYPLHEIDTEGQSVFVLDGKLKQLGYGRYNARVLLGEPEAYEPTDLVFDIDYVASVGGIGAISTETLLPNQGEC